MTTLGEKKTALRATFTSTRKSLATALSPSIAGQALITILTPLLETLPDHAPISGFWPIGSEVDPRPLITALHHAGHTIGLPVVVARDAPLIFRHWTPTTEMVPGTLKIPTPPETAREITPLVLFVPMLAFDAQGYRLGYGGGFYDRTLAAARGEGRQVFAIGLAYDGQHADADLPREATDMPLDFIATESALYRITNTDLTGS